MTCYHRHLTGLFPQVDVPYDADGRRRVHAAILATLHLPDDAHCPEVWSALKHAYGPVPERSEQLARDVARELATG